MVSPEGNRQGLSNTAGDRAGLIANGVLLAAATGGGTYGLVAGPAIVGDLAVTAHGALRIGSEVAGRGGQLSALHVLTVRNGTHTILRQSDGAVVRIAKTAEGRLNVVIEGSRGIITTMRNWSQKSIDKIAEKYGWTKQ
jgi:hypothetical protein